MSGVSFAKKVYDKSSVSIVYDKNFLDDHITYAAGINFMIPSSNEDALWDVSYSFQRNLWKCDCPAFEKSNEDVEHAGNCKHIDAAKVVTAIGFYSLIDSCYTKNGHEEISMVALFQAGANIIEGGNGWRAFYANDISEDLKGLLLQL